MMKSFVSLHFSIFGFLTTFYLLSYLLVLEYFIYTSLIGEGTVNASHVSLSSPALRVNRSLRYTFTYVPVPRP